MLWGGTTWWPWEDCLDCLVALDALGWFMHVVSASVCRARGAARLSGFQRYLRNTCVV